MRGRTMIMNIIINCLILSVYGGSKYKRVCYYTNWSQYRSGIGNFMPEDIDPFLCTHIMYSFGKLEGNRITNYEWNDPDSLWADGLYTRVNNLKKQNTDLKVLLAMGGWNAGSVVYSQMSSTPNNRREFIDSALEFLRDNNFDGLDMDWEYPARRGGAAADFTNFGLLVQELRKAFDDELLQTGRDRLLLTAAVAAGKTNIDGVYNVPIMASNMDFICLMTYDFNGAWGSVTGHNSPLDASSADADKTWNMKWAAAYWHQLGLPKDKLIVGLATYGRAFTLSDPNNYGVGAPTISGSAPSGPYTKEKGFLSYYEICEMQNSGSGTTYRDIEAMVPYYVDGTTWVGFDDEISIYNKVKNFIIPNGYGGAMVWALPLDDFNAHCTSKKFPLISTIKEIFDAEENGGSVNPSSASPTVLPVSTLAPTQLPTAVPTAAPTGAPTTISPGGTEFCADKPNGQQGDPTDCTAYYNCWAGKGRKLKCSQGLLWNQQVKYCDHAHRVVCTTSQPQTAAPPTTTQPTAAPTTNVPNGEFCADKPNGLQGDPTDCMAYYNCWAGQGRKLKCSQGLLWNKQVKYCDHAHRVVCTTSQPQTAAPPTTTQPTAAPTTKRPTTNDPNKEFCAGKPNGLQGDPTDCMAYYNCWSGQGKKLKCSQGLLWNQQVEYCDHAHRVVCTTSQPQTAAPPTTTQSVTYAPVNEVDCTALPNGLYSFPGDCNKYITCSYGHSYEGACHPALYFNFVLQNCDWPSNVSC